MNKNACLSNAFIRSSSLAGLSLMAWKIFVAALRTVHKNKPISLFELPSSLVLSSASGAGYKQLREAIKSLHAVFYKDQPIFEELDFAKGAIVGIWHPSFHPQLQPQGEFTRADFSNIHFRSAHSYRLYWLLLSWYKINQNVVQSLEELRHYFFGSETSFADFANLRRSFLDVVVKDFLAQDINLSYTLEKKQRVVAKVKWHLRLDIQEEEKAVPAVVSQEEIELEKATQEWLTRRDSPELSALYLRLQVNNQLLRNEVRFIIKQLHNDQKLIAKAHASLNRIKNYQAKCLRDGLPRIKDIVKYTRTVLKKDIPNLLFLDFE